MSGKGDGKDFKIYKNPEGFPEPDKYRRGCLQQIIGLSMGAPMEDLGKVMTELNGFATQ